MATSLPLFSNLQHLLRMMQKCLQLMDAPASLNKKVWGVLEVVQSSVLRLGWEGYQGLRARQYPHHSLPGDGA